MDQTNTHETCIKPIKHKYKPSTTPIDHMVPIRFSNCLIGDMGLHGGVYCIHETQDTLRHPNDPIIHP